MTRADLIQELWVNEVKQLEWQGKPLRLIILGEAPLSPSKYFYVNNGNYLRELKKIYFDKCGINLPMLNYHMYRDRILLLELYKEPLPTSEFDVDIEMKHWADEHFENQIQILKTAGLLDSIETKIVFRYKKLCQNSAAKGKKVEEHIDKHILPILLKYGLNKGNFLLEYHNGKERYATISTGGFGNGDMSNENSVVNQYLYEITNCNLNYSEENNIFSLLLDLLKRISNPSLKVGSIPKPKTLLDWDSEKVRKQISEDIKNIEENLDNLERLQNLDPVIIQNVFDLLGYFSSNNPDSIALLPISIYLTASRNRWKMEDLLKIVYIHECAHYVHFHLNPKDFTCCPFSDRKVYVESWAQLVTERIATDNPYLLNLFLQLLQDQPEEYKNYREMKCPIHKFPEDIIFEFFLEKFNGKCNDCLTQISQLLESKLRGMLPSLSEEEKEFYELSLDLRDLGFVECLVQTLESVTISLKLPYNSWTK